MSQSSVQPGTRFGNYVTECLIGKGGMGEVYRAKSSFLNRVVALKTIPLRLRNRADINERFAREARALSRINHANVVAILDGGVTDDNVAYIVMEYLDGITLRELVRRMGRLPLKVALSFGAQIADANAAIHAAMILHRDNKPENAYILRGGRVKVIDFGLARFRDHAAQTTVKPLNGNGPLGTVHYMAPEQLLAEGEVTDKADVYAICLIVWEIITGLHVFQHSTSEFPAAAVVRLNHQMATPRALKDVVPGVPKDLSDLVARGLSKLPYMRPTARELAAELSAILARLTGLPLVPAPGQATTDREKPSRLRGLVARSRALLSKLAPSARSRPISLERGLSQPSQRPAMTEMPATKERRPIPLLTERISAGSSSAAYSLSETSVVDTTPNSRWKPYEPTDPDAPAPTDFASSGKPAATPMASRSVRTHARAHPRARLDAARGTAAGISGQDLATTDLMSNPAFESAPRPVTARVPVEPSRRRDVTSGEARAPAVSHVGHDAGVPLDRRPALRWMGVGMVLGVVINIVAFVHMGILRISWQGQRISAPASAIASPAPPVSAASAASSSPPASSSAGSPGHRSQAIEVATSPTPRAPEAVPGDAARSPSATPASSNKSASSLTAASRSEVLR